jgi:hypothetical protein
MHSEFVSLSENRKVTNREAFSTFYLCALRAFAPLREAFFPAVNV